MLTNKASGAFDAAAMPVRQKASDLELEKSTARQHPMYMYRAYGLVFRSELRLDELVATEVETPDVEIRLGETGQFSSAQESSAMGFNEAKMSLEWSGVGRFRVRDASCIVVEPAKGATEHILHLPLLGPVMALLLQRRGFLVMHASAISLRERGAIFLGDKGVGKSTIAAALVASGSHLMSDDIVAVDFSWSDGPRLPAGFPQLKLHADAAVVLGEKGTVSRTVPGLKKRLYNVSEDFFDAALRPHRVYLLRRGSSPRLTPLAPQEALASLICHSYMARVSLSLLRGEAADTHLRQCASLANSVRVSVLDMPRDLGALPEVIALLHDDLG